jgi:hypothetical protein
MYFAVFCVLIAWRLFPDTFCIKVVVAKQASIMNRYLNIKSKLLITNANIWFNKQALFRKVTPKYVKVKVTGNSRQAIKTQKTAEYIKMKMSFFKCFK